MKMHHMRTHLVKAAGEGLQPGLQVVMRKHAGDVHACQGYWLWRVQQAQVCPVRVAQHCPGPGQCTGRSMRQARRMYLWATEGATLPGRKDWFHRRV